MLKFIIVCFFLGNILQIFGDVTDDSIALQLEDNTIEGKFSSFAKLNLRLSKQIILPITPSRTISAFQSQRHLSSIVSPSSYYTLKVHFKRHSIHDYILTSIPMCLIVQARFEYNITLFVNENGYIVSANIQTKNSTCYPMRIEENRTEFVYNISLRIRLNDLGPQPEIQSFLDKLKREKEAKFHAQEIDNRPFLLKYWKYLLPIVVIFVLQGAFADPGANGGR